MALRLFCILCFSVVVTRAEQQEIELVFNKPTRVPGKQLKAGAYHLRVLGRLTDRVLLEVSGDRSGRSAVSFIGLPDNNLPHLPKDAPVYWDAAGHPVVRGIWISDPPMGVAFVFEKEEAAKLAKQVRQPIPAIDPASENLKPLPAMSDADRKMVTLWLLSAVAVTPGGGQVGIQAVKYTPETQATSQTASSSSAPAATPSTTRTSNSQLVARQSAPSERTARMPKTAGNWPSFLFTGGVLLFIGLGLLIGVRTDRLTFHNIGQR